MVILENLKRRLSRFSAHGIRSRALAFGLTAAAAPLTTMVALSAGSTLEAKLASLFTLALSSAALIGLIRSLRPVTDLAVLLDRHAGGAGLHDGRGRDHHQRLMTNLQVLAQRLSEEERRAGVDPVTGLPTRERLLNAIAQSLRARPNAPAMLGLVRVANYEHLSTFNPGAADRVLSAVAKRLMSAAKPGRSLAHVDRDCFAIWFEDDAAAKGAAELEAIGYVLVHELQCGEFSVTPDIQLGSARFPLDADEPGNLLNRAFVSIARPQRTADGAIAFFARPTPEEAKRRFLLEQDLRKAIRRGELALHYQPIVDLAAGRVAGAEALLRWRSERHAAARPDQVVRVLEETGLVHEIGLWTLNTACRQLRQWCDSGIGDFKLAVNLSAHQLRDPALPVALERTLAAHGLSPSQIELELTETAAMEDAVRTLEMFRRLRETGFSLAIDDFGSGYSSLAYLRRLPFQKLKIDREFVAHIDQRSDSQAICKALIDLTAGLELAVLAEGVERFEEVEALRAMGCSTFQGFYFARPLPPDEFMSLVTRADWLARLGSRVRREHEELRRRLS